MSKIKLLLDVVSGLHSLADSVQAVADAMIDSAPAENAAMETAASATHAQPPTNPITLEQVRVVLAGKSQDGFSAEVRALLQKHGAAKLSEIVPDRYAALLADAEELSRG